MTRRSNLPAQPTTKPTNPKDMVGTGKAPLSTLPLGVITEMGLGMLEGALKYGRHNYRAMGVRGSIYFDATMRHLIAYWEGQDEDPDTCDKDDNGQPIPGTGVHHITKALTSLAVWRDAQMQGMETDDRPPRSVEFYTAANARAAKLVGRAPSPAPHHYTIADTPQKKAKK